jgi:glycosyltransferase involved in cell wall biosynthesis
MTPSVSVVIPTRDRRDLLRIAIRSAQRQRDVDLEVIVVDDGSRDGSAEMTRSIGDPRIRVLRNEHALGVATARNTGADEARGAWIAFLDDDDVWSPDKLRLQLAAAADGGTVWVYGGAVEIDAAGSMLGGDPPPQPAALADLLHERNAMPAGCSNVLVRAAEFQRLGGFDPKLRHLPDWDLWLRLVSIGKPAAVRDAVVGYRIHDGQATLDTTGMIDEARVLRSRHGTSLASIYRWLAWSELRRGRRKDAIASYLRAVAAGDPTSLARVVVAAVHPRPVALGSRHASPASLEWRRGAASWLAALQAG